MNYQDLNAKTILAKVLEFRIANIAVHNPIIRISVKNKDIFHHFYLNYNTVVDTQ